jgi:hypothetical protein
MAEFLGHPQGRDEELRDVETQVQKGWEDLVTTVLDGSSPPEGVFRERGAIQDWIAFMRTRVSTLPRQERVDLLATLIRRELRHGD